MAATPTSSTKGLHSGSNGGTLAGHKQGSAYPDLRAGRTASDCGSWAKQKKVTANAITFAHLLNIIHHETKKVKCLVALYTSIIMSSTLHPTLTRRLQWQEIG